MSTRSHAEPVAAIAAELSACRVCAPEFRATATGHEPRPIVALGRRARIVIASQAPGMKAHVSGVPFDDPSGARLRDWLGVDRKTFFESGRFAIAPMAFCFPGYDAAGNDLPPPQRCAALWRTRVLSALPGVKLTLLIGAHAQRWATGVRRTLTKTVADWRSFGEAVFPLPHPSWRNSAWLKRNPWFEAEALPILRARVAALL